MCLCASKTFYLFFKLSTILLRWVMKCFLCLVMIMRENRCAIFVRESDRILCCFSLSVSDLGCVLVLDVFSQPIPARPPPHSRPNSFLESFSAPNCVCTATQHDPQSNLIWAECDLCFCVKWWKKMIIIVSPKPMIKVFEDLMFNFVLRNQKIKMMKTKKQKQNFWMKNLFSHFVYYDVKRKKDENITWWMT